MSAHPPALPWIERKLYDDVRGLFGQPDRVEEDGLLRVLDLKSGVRQGAITEAQIQQLFLYAHLVHVVSGRLPDEVVLQDVRGTEQSSPVSKERVADMVELAVQARAQFNDVVLSGGDFVASPSDHACAFCSFRVICSDYWNTRNDDWSGSAVRGTVAAVGVDGLEIAVDGSASVARLIGQGTQDAVQGEELVAVDLLRAGPGVFRTKWNSALRRASQQDSHGSSPRIPESGA